MTLHIVVPVKRLAEAKRRLAPVLTDEERLALSWSLLRHVLAVVQQAQEALPARGLVISGDSAVLRAADTLGLALLDEASPPGAGAPARVSAENSNSSPDSPLNAALEQAALWACREGASALLVLPADLPLVALEDVEALWRASQQLASPSSLVIAPDGRGAGTNALLVRPPDALRFQFGPDSFRRHCQQAQRLGLACHIHRSPRLELDVDLPGDLAGPAEDLARPES